MEGLLTTAGSSSLFYQHSQTENKMWSKPERIHMLWEEIGEQALLDY